MKIIQIQNKNLEITREIVEYRPYGIFRDMMENLQKLECLMGI